MRLVALPTWFMLKLINPFLKKTNPLKGVGFKNWADGRTSYAAKFDHALWVWVAVILILVFQ